MARRIKAKAQTSSDEPSELIRKGLRISLPSAREGRPMPPQVSISLTTAWPQSAVAQPTVLNNRRGTGSRSQSRHSSAREGGVRRDSHQA